MGLVHRGDIDSELASADRDVPIFVFMDFRRVRHATASYLKATWLALALSGVEHFDGQTVARVDGAPPRNTYPIVIGLNEEIRHELALVAESAGLVAIEARDESDPIRAVRVHGRLEPVVAQTLRALEKRGEPSTAPELHAKSDGGVAVTAWNNRLNELCRLRLATRSRDGRQVRYAPIAAEVQLG